MKPAGVLLMAAITVIGMGLASCGRGQAVGETHPPASSADTSGRGDALPPKAEDEAPAAIPFADWLDELQFAHRDLYDLDYRHENSVVTLRCYTNVGGLMRQLADADIRPGNPAGETLPLEVPFVLYYTMGDRREELAFSAAGIRWNGALYFPREPEQMHAFLEASRLGQADPIRHLQDDLPIDANGIDYIVLSRGRLDRTDVLVRDREKIHQVAAELAKLPAQSLEEMEFPPQGSAWHYMSCTLVMQDGTVYVVNKTPGYVKIDDGAPIPYHFHGEYGLDPYLCGIFADGKDEPESDPEGDAFGYIDSVPQLRVTADNELHIRPALHSYHYAENLRLYDCLGVGETIDALSPEEILHCRNQPAREITLPHWIAGKEDIYELRPDSPGEFAFAYTVRGEVVEPLDLEVHVYHDPGYRHPDGAVPHWYRLTDAYELRDKRQLPVRGNTASLPLDGDTRIVEVIAQFPQGWVKHFFAYEGGCEPQ